MKQMSADAARKMIFFNKDYTAVQNTDIVLIILDGRVIDEGAYVELGIGYAFGKSCFGLKPILVLWWTVRLINDFWLFA